MKETPFLISKPFTPLPAEPFALPLMPLRDVVVFPHMVIPLFVGRPKSIKALEAALGEQRRIMLVAQRSATQEEPGAADLHETGCIAPCCKCSSCLTAP